MRLRPFLRRAEKRGFGSDTVAAGRSHFGETMNEKLESSNTKGRCRGTVLPVGQQDLHNVQLHAGGAAVFGRLEDLVVLVCKYPENENQKQIQSHEQSKKQDCGSKGDERR